MKLGRLVQSLGIAVLGLSAGIALSADLVITNARLIDGTGAEPQTGVNIVVTGKHIEKVTTKKVRAGNARVIDAAGKTVMPGLIEGHGHLTIDNYYPHLWEKFPESDADVEAYLEKRMPGVLAPYIEVGVTTVMTLGDFWPFVLDWRDRIDRGEVYGPRLLAAGGIFTAPEGHPAGNVCDLREWCRQHLAVEVDDEEKAREWVRRYVESGVDAIKFARDDILVKGHKLDEKVMAAIIDEAKKLDAWVIGEVTNVRDIRGAVDAGVNALTHVTRNGYDSDGLVARYLAENNVPVTPTLGGTAYEIKQGNYVYHLDLLPFHEFSLRNTKKLVEEGVTIMMGTDLEGVDPRISIYIEFEELKGVGLSNMQIIQAATRNIAHGLMGRTDLGTIEKGMLADMLIIDGDPLMDLNEIKKLKTVIKDGRVMLEK